MSAVKRILTVVVLLAVCSALFSGCKKAEKASKDEGLTIVCTFLPVYVMTLNVAGDLPGVTVYCMLPPEVGCPHDYALTPQDAVILEKADVLVMNGMGMESFLEDSPFLSREGLEIINASETIQPISLVETEHGHRHHENHDYLLNPHTWVSPVAAAEMTRKIGKRLAKINKKYAGPIVHNTHHYTVKLDSLADSLRRIVSKAQNRRIVTLHSNFDYFARDLGLEIVGVISLDTSVKPSAKEMAELIEKIRNVNPVGIFHEVEASDRLVKVLAEETGAPIYILDPATTGETDADSYLAAMRRNMATLITAFGLEKTSQ